MSNSDRFKRLRDRVQAVLENFTMNQELNAEIERRFLTIDDPNMRMYVQTAAEMLWAAGSAGLTPKQWAEKVDSMLQFEPRTEPMTKPILLATKNLFPDHIMDHNGRARWYDVAMDQKSRKQMVISIEMSSECMRVISQARRPMSLREWATAVAVSSGAQSDFVAMYLEMHFIPHMNMITQDDAGNYYVKSEDRPSAMDILDKIASGEVVIPLDDE